MTDDKGAGMNEKMYSDVMNEIQCSRMDGFSRGFKRGRESRECLRKALEYAIAQYNYPEKFSSESNHWTAVAFNALGEDDNV